MAFHRENIAFTITKVSILVHLLFVIYQGSALTINSQSKAVLVAADTASLFSWPAIDHFKDCMNAVFSNLNRFVKTGKLMLNFGKTNSLTFYTNNKTCVVRSVGRGNKFILI